MKVYDENLKVIRIELICIKVKPTFCTTGEISMHVLPIQVRTCHVKVCNWPRYVRYRPTFSDPSTAS